MRQILSTNDIVHISWATALLTEAGIQFFTLDNNMSVLEGSTDAIPRRLMVMDDDYEKARDLIEMADQERKQSLLPSYVLGGRVSLLQPEKGFRAGIEPIMLAASIPDGKLGQVLDLGCGVGTAALCYASRVEGTRIVGIEKQTKLGDLAVKNVLNNGFDRRVTILNEDILFLSNKLANCSFCHVMANPPFVSAKRANPKMHPSRWSSHVEGAAKLQDWVSVAHSLLETKGTFTVIYDAGRVDNLISLLSAGFGGITIFPLWPSTMEKGRDAKRVLVQARKGVKSPSRLAVGMVLHQTDGSYTPAAASILEHGSSLVL